MFILVLQRIFLEAFLDIFYFPLWWYTGGAKHALLWCLDLFLSGNSFLAPWLWFVNLMVPMYGQRDFAGRIISFFMRLAQLFARTLALLIWFLVCLFLFFVWLVLPVVLVYGFINSLK